jgi:small subunit ribosomal protein S4e
MHFKRKTIPKFWPIPRKGTKYIAVPSHNQYDSIPLVVVMRDILKFVKNKKELKKLLNEKQILVNYKVVKETNYAISLLDILGFPAMKKNYKAILSQHKKIEFLEVSGKEAETKVYKVIGKKVLPKNKIQINLMNGRNIFTKEKVKTGDSVLFDLKTNKIIKFIPLEKGKNVYITEGKHAGKTGKINELVERGGKRIAKISTEQEKINVWIKSILVLD